MDIHLLLFFVSMALADEDIADINGVDRKQLDDDLGPAFPFEAFGIGYEDFLKKIHPPMLSAMNYRPVMPYDIPQMESQSVLASVATIVATTEMNAKGEQSTTQKDDAEEWEEIVASSSEELATERTLMTKDSMDSPSTRYYEEKSNGYDVEEADVRTEEVVVEGLGMGQESSTIKSGVTEEYSQNPQTTSKDSTTKSVEISGLSESRDGAKAGITDKSTSGKDETTAKSGSSAKSRSIDDISVDTKGSDREEGVLSKAYHLSGEKVPYFAESEAVTKVGSSSAKEEETLESESSEFEMASTDYYSDEYFYYFPGYMYVDSSESDSSFSSEESESSSFESESFSTGDTETQIEPNKEFLADKVEIISSFDISYHDSLEGNEGSKHSKSSGDSSPSFKMASKFLPSESESSPSRSVSSGSSLSSQSGKSSFSASAGAAVSTSFSMGKHVGSSSDSDIKSTTVSDSKRSRELLSQMEKEKSISEKEKSKNQKLNLEDLKKIVEESYSELARLRKKVFKKENVLDDLNQVIDDLQKMCDKICRTVPPQYMVEDSYSR